jgi:hypothetical protein
MIDPKAAENGVFLNSTSGMTALLNASMRTALSSGLKLCAATSRRQVVSDSGMDAQAGTRKQHRTTRQEAAEVLFPFRAMLVLI